MRHNVEQFLSELVSGINKTARHFARGDSHLADDLKQEALLSCLRVFTRYPNHTGSQLVALAGRAAINAMKDCLRKESYRKTSSEFEWENLQIVHSSEELVACRDTVVFLMSQLTDKQKQVLSTLVNCTDDGCEPSGLSTKEAAQLVSMGHSTFFAVQVEMRKKAAEVLLPESQE